jgi:hypothetical protein
MTEMGSLACHTITLSDTIFIAVMLKKHTLLAVCCIIAFVSLPMVSVAEGPPLDGYEIGMEPSEIGDDNAFETGIIDVDVDDGRQVEHDTTPNMNKSNADSGDDTKSNADVGVCVVGAGGPCN